MQVPELRQAGLSDLARGFALPLRALSLLFATKALRRLTLAMAAITFATLVILLVVLWNAAPAMAALAVGHSPSWWAVALRTLLGIALFLGLFLLGANALPLTLAAPLMDPLSIQTERAVGIAVPEGGGFWRTLHEIARSISNGLLRLLVLGLGEAVLLFLLLIPGVGGPLWTGLSWAWAAIWLAAAYLDVPMARYLYTLDHEIAVLKQRFWLCLGFGAAVALMLWVPLLNCFFVPVAVVGSTLMFRGLVAAGALPPPAAPTALR
jgi:CysZ protein